MKAKGITAQIYSHPLGFQGHGLGLSIVLRIAELQARTYHESQNKAVYYVRSVYRKEPAPGQDPAKGDDAPQ